MMLNRIKIVCNLAPHLCREARWMVRWEDAIFRIVAFLIGYDRFIVKIYCICNIAV